MSSAHEEVSRSPPTVLPGTQHTSSRNLLLLAIWGALAEASALILWFGAAQPKGMLFLLLDGKLTIWYGQRLWPLVALVLCGLSCAIVVQATSVAAQAASAPRLLTTHWRGAASLSIGIGVAGALVAVWVLRAFPNSSDEYDYLFQAKTLLAGRLWNPAPPLSDLFAFFNQSFWNGRWASLYPPGWPLLIAAVMALRLPSWLACPLIGGLLLFAVLKLGQRRDGALGGVLAVILVGFSPFFIFNAGSYFNMMAATAAGLLFCWAASDFLDRPQRSTILLAGAALGALGLIRPFDVPVFGLPFAVGFLWRGQRRHYFFAPLILIAGLPFLAALLFYNDATTGSFLPNVGRYAPLVRFGLFPVNLQGLQLTPFNELHFILVRLIMLAEWTSPFLVLGYFGAFAWGVGQRRLNFLDFIFPAYVLAYMLVPFDGGAQYGPRYYFEGFPFLVLTVVSALAPLLQDTARLRRTSFVVSLLVAHGATCVAAAAIFGLFLRVVVDQRMDVYDQVRAAGLHNAVVVLRSGTSPIRPMTPQDLTRNGITIDGPVIYARNIPDQLNKLHMLLPHRTFYTYERDPSSPKGQLRCLW